MPTWTNDALAYGLLERRLAMRDYAGEFRKLAASKGYSWQPCGCAPPPSPVKAKVEAKLAEKQQLAEECTPEFARAFDEREPVCEAEAAALNAAKRSQTATTAHKAALARYYHQRCFRSLVDFQHYEATRHHMERIRNVAASLRVADAAAFQAWEEKKLSGTYVDSTEYRFTRHALMRELSVDVLGLQSPTDCATAIPRQRLINKQGALQQLYSSKLQIEFRLEAVQWSEAKGCKQLVGAINRVLHAWGHAELRCSRSRKCVDGKRQEDSTYRLCFLPVEGLGGSATVLKLSEDSRFFGGGAKQEDSP
jgi:hypothetical protein